MDVILTLDNEYEKELSITVPWEAVNPDYQDLLKRYSKLPVKGFRPGKSPAGLIESHFREPIKNDLLAKVSTRLCRKALKDMNIVAGSPIEISGSSLEKDKCLKFTAAFIEMPSFELPDYADLGLLATDKSGQLDEMSEKLLDLTEISLHPSFVEKELEYSVAGDEADPETDRNNAEARVKLMLILKKIASQEQIEVDEKDIEERIRTVAAENEVTPEYLKKILIENRGLSRLADSLLAEAVLDYILDIQN